MKVDLYNIDGQKSGLFELPEIFSSKINENLMAQSVHVYLANQRNSYAKVKTRHDVSGTTKKVWSQKGTGRARHGSRKAPIFVGGGSAHGPRGNQNYTLTLSKKMQKAALASILSQIAKNKKIVVVNDMDSIEPKTKKAGQFIAQLDLADKKRVGVVLSSSQTNPKRAFKNIKNVSLLDVSSLNVYELSRQHFLVFSKKSIESIQKK